MKWSLLLTQDCPPSPRDRHVSVTHDRCIYIYGGYDGYNRVSDFYEYNVDTNTWRLITPESTVQPSARHSHAAVVYEGCMYVFAGYDGLYRNDFYKFDFGTRRWSAVVDALGANEH